MRVAATLLMLIVCSDPTKDHADVEQRRESHLEEVKAKAGAEVKHVSSS